MPTLAEGIRGDEQLTDAKCRRCGYALRTLEQDVCPECGRRFDRYNAWTVWLPDKPNLLARWLLRRPTIVGRAIPFLGALAVAYATRVPGLDDIGSRVAFILYAACGLTVVVWHTAIVSISRRGYSARAPRRHLRRFARRIGWSLVVSIVLVAFRPTLYLSFWISRPWFDHMARDVLSQPHSQNAPYIGGVRGLYFIEYVRRCPHGVKVKVGSRYDGDWDGGPGFFYRPDGGAGDPCTRFQTGRALGGGWYVSE